MMVSVYRFINNYFSYFIIVFLSITRPLIFADDCGGEMTAGDVVFLTSPGYPQSAAEKDSTYPADMECVWSASGAEDTLVGMKFLDMKVQPGDGGSNETCEYDFVEISIDSIDGRKYCGFNKHPDAIVGLGSVEIVFKTDDKYNFRGWKLAYKITPEFDPCKDNMCKQGECVSDDGIKARCDCEGGFTGTLCETDIAECDSDPCQNNGTCDDSTGADHYSCDCPFEYYGDNCEIAKVPACDDNPCENGGTCTDLPLFEYECECKEFFIGVNCSIESGCTSPGLPNIDDSKRFHRGTKLKFNCREGFEMEGDNETLCQEDDSWSTPVPDCKVWGPWKKGECSQTCGAGKRNDTRVCVEGGCDGEYFRVVFCNINMCPYEKEDEEEEEESKISQTFIITIAILGSIFILYSAFFLAWMIFRGPWGSWKDSVKIMDVNDDEERCSRNNIQTVSGSARFSPVDFLSVKEE